jgi:hypothetical protein
MTADLASTPAAGLQVRLCGDAHLSNSGAFASPERNLVFDVNDFDETLPGPFEWDVERLAASLAGQRIRRQDAPQDRPGGGGGVGGLPGNEGGSPDGIRPFGSARTGGLLPGRTAVCSAPAAGGSYQCGCWSPVGPDMSAAIR